MILAKETDDGEIVLEADNEIYACPLVTHGQIVCAGGRSPEEAVENARRFRDNDIKIQERAKDLWNQGLICKQANLTRQAEQYFARAKKLDSEVDSDD